MAVTFEIKGLEALQKKVHEIPKKVYKRIDGEVKDYCTEINAAQIRLAPTDRGPLRQNITFEKVKGSPTGLDYRILCQVPYAAYVEFGTRKKFKAINGIDASKFKGKGTGDYFDFLNNILDWVKRKGIASTYSTGIVKNKGGKKSGYSMDLSKSGRRSTKKADLLRIAEAIAFSIMRNGIKPQPFFFAPFLAKREELKRRIDVIVKSPLA